ncbi:hypothetical protein TUN_45150 [Bacillus sp. M21]|nr:hypothetical protein TUN_45150 [Bacillus sp. M21]
MRLYGTNLTKKIHTTLFLYFPTSGSVLSSLFQDIEKNRKKIGGVEKQRRLKF